MNPKVPLTTPGIVSVVSPASATALERLASPKSTTFTVPRSVTMTFPGFRSRCTMPASWAAASAAAMGIASFRASRGAIPDFGISACRLWPATYSIAMKSVPASLPAW